jgi:putative transposase
LRHRGLAGDKHVGGLAGRAQLDIAVIEFWHSTPEFELRSLREFATGAQARAAVAAWIEDYNTVGRHSALGMLSPAAYEQSLKGKDSP